MDLLEVRVTDECLGSGAYGSVIKVINAKGEICAGKIIHPIIIDEIDGEENINIRNFTKECDIMFQVEHDNITKFLGLSRQPNLRLPILVMEKLEGNLHDLLEHYTDPCLPLNVKIAILSNVADGLHYLHNHPANLCILHRDLTVMNVLLTSNLVAKIADFGMSRLFNDKYFPRIMTSGPPGHFMYMPPEANLRSGDDNKIRYGPELDIFSFGHLALVTLTQMVKENLMAATYFDGSLVPRSEVERRRSFFEKLNQVLDEPMFLSLKERVTDCLHNSPEERPSSYEVKQSLQEINEEGTISQAVIDRGVSLIRNAEESRTSRPMKSFKFSDNIMKLSFLLVVLVAGLVFFLMASSGFLLQTVLNKPLFSFLVSGVIMYSFGFLFDFVFNGWTRLLDSSHLRIHFPAWLSLWCVVFSIIFMSFIPPLSLTTRRIIFRRSVNCNAFDNPAIYICYNLEAGGNNQVFYTTTRRECVANVPNSTVFYITSLWIPPKNQFKLNKGILFKPLKGAAYNLPSGYCIQSAETNDTHVKVEFYSWKKQDDGFSRDLQDTGFIHLNDLDEFNSGWYKVSNCRWEISTWLSTCTNGYVSAYYVNVPGYMKALLHSN